MTKEKEYEILKEKIKYYNRKYYAENESIISDYEYDKLYQEFKDLARSLQKPDYIPYSELSDKSSPLKKVIHPVVIRSLKTEYTTDRLLQFQDFIARKITADKNANWDDLIDKMKSFILQPKIDGLSVIFYYKKGVFNLAATRGNFFIGEDITYNIQHMQGFPKKLTKKIDLVLRAELYCPLSVFKEINANIEEGESVYAHPRNFASASARILDTKEFLKRDLKLYFYDHLASCLEDITPNEDEELSLNEGEVFANDGVLFTKRNEEVFANDDDFYEFLKAEGFDCFPKDYIQKLEDLKNLNQETLNFYQKAYEPLDAPTDGLVIKINDYTLRQKIGFTNQTVQWATSYKFETEKVVTQLKDISSSVSRYGELTPIALFDPVYISGTLVKRANLFNFEQIYKKNISPGDFIKVEKSGEIIPNVTELVKKNTEDSFQPFKIPEYCPSCSRLLTIPKKKKRTLVLKCLSCKDSDILRLSLQGLVLKYKDPYDCFYCYKKRKLHFFRKVHFSILKKETKDVDYIPLLICDNKDCFKSLARFKKKTEKIENISPSDIIEYKLELWELKDHFEKERKNPFYCHDHHKKKVLEYQDIKQVYQRVCIYKSTCYDQIIERYKHFVSKDAMDIRDFSIASIKIFVNEGFIKNIWDIYQLDFDILLKQLKGKGFAEKGLRKIEKNIEESKKKPWENLLYAIGIRGLGFATIDLIKKKYNGFYELMDIHKCTSPNLCSKNKTCQSSIKCLGSIKGIGQVQEEEIFSFFQEKGNRDMIYQFEKLGLNISKKEEKDKYSIAQSLYANKSFCITGSIKGYSRKEIWNWLESLGAIIHRDIKKDTDYLMIPSYGDVKNSSKLEKAKNLGIKIISYEDLKKSLENKEQNPA